MLIEFSVKNYLSFRDRQTLTLVASNRDKKLPDNLVELGLPGLTKTKLLKSAAVYGANASGKSNLYKAAEFMKSFVENSATGLKPGSETGVVPFRLDPESEQSPSEFEAIFIHDSVRYQYGIAVDRKRIWGESLIAYPSGQPQRWFERAWNSETANYDWTFGNKLKGEKEQLKAATRENSLFLSVAAQLNHEQLSKVYEWFNVRFLFLDFSSAVDTLSFTASLIVDDEEVKHAVTALVKQADLGIIDIEAELTKMPALEAPDFLSDEAKEKFLEDVKAQPFVALQLIHRTKDKRQGITFGFKNESAGTRKYFSLLGPWLDSLHHGYTVLIDEIGATMHPLLVRNLLSMIHSPEHNRKNAQLVFTTHDTTLLDTSRLRRDQIWFTEKDADGATSLYPLTDFKPRPAEALQKGYLAGRYGAIPFLKGDLPF